MFIVHTMPRHWVYLKMGLPDAYHQRPVYDFHQSKQVRRYREFWQLPAKPVHHREVLATRQGDHVWKRFNDVWALPMGGDGQRP